MSVSLSNNHGGIIATYCLNKLQGSSEQQGGCGEWLRSAGDDDGDGDRRALMRNSRYKNKRRF